MGYGQRWNKKNYKWSNKHQGQKSNKKSWLSCPECGGESNKAPWVWYDKCKIGTDQVCPKCGTAWLQLAIQAGWTPPKALGARKGEAVT